MVIDKDDPRLTAFALGELEGAEKDDFERLLQDDPAARAEVDAIRGFGGELSTELKQAPAPALTELQRARIAQALPSPRPARTWPWYVRPELLVAAGVLAVAGMGLQQVKDSPGAAYQKGAGDIDPAIAYDPRPTTTEAPPPRGTKDELERLAQATQAELDQYRRALEQAQAVGDRARADAERMKLLQLAELKRDVNDVLLVEGVLASNTPGQPGAPVTVTVAPTTETPERVHPGEAYEPLPDNPFKATAGERLSTFSIDVDTASYANIRRYLQQQYALPPREAVRIEELVNYFPYEYAPPTGEHPFATNVEVTTCPWQRDHRLVRIGIKGREVAEAERPATNLVFLIDVSGSMSAANKLPLVQQSLRLLAERLRPHDRVAIVVYAGASGLVLESTPGDRKAEVVAALERLSAGGSTNGGAGLQLAYDVASRHFVEGGVNRVILCTDGDWNVGPQGPEQLQALIEEKARSKVFLTVLGFGMGNYKDSTLELLADKGNGNYGYVDALPEAKKLLVEQLSGTLVTIAKDVKVQVEWNPARVASYRLIGYENRVLANQDFADDRKDAGEIGAGHTVTALYEVVPAAGEGELMTLRLRYKQPEGDVSRLIETKVDDSSAAFDSASTDLRFAAAVASFGLVLRESPHRGQATLAMAEELATSALGRDPHGHRAEFVQLVKAARQLTNR